MKKQLLSLLVLSVLSINTIFGQYQISATGANDMRLRTNNTDRVNILTNGNVGIGTPTPNAKLNINGDLSIGNKLTYSTVGVQNALNRNGSSRIFINGFGSVTLNGIAGGVDGLIIFLYTDSGTTLTINNTDGSAAIADRIATHTGGSVIINGRGGVTLMYDVAKGYWRIIGFADENTSWFLNGNAGTNPVTNFMGTTDAQPLIVKTNNVERMRVLSMGNIGIGTNSPDTKLHVVVGNSGALGLGNAILTVENDKDANISVLSGSGYRGGLLFGSTLGNAKGQITYSPTVNTMSFGTNDLTRMAIDGNGKIGIGINAPESNLHVWNGSAGAVTPVTDRKSVV